MSTKTKQRLPWYDFSRLWSFNAQFNAVLGARGTGKTFGAKVKGIKDAIHKGHEFIYLRRFTDDIQETKESFFADIIAENIFPGIDFKVQGNKGFWDYATNNDAKDAKRPWKLCVHFFALSTGARRKSMSFPKVHLIIFDEFILDEGVTHYLPNEVNALMNFYSTVDRNTDRVRVLMLSNSVSIMNPYFLSWKVEPEDTQEWMILYDGFIAIHFHDSTEFAQAVYQTRFGQFIQGTQFGDYAVGNSFKDNHDLMIATKTPDARYMLTIETIHGGAMSIWLDRSTWTYYAQRKRPKQENIYTLDPHNVSPHRTLWIGSDPLLGTLKTAFRHGKMWFDAAQTRNAFRELL